MTKCGANRINPRVVRQKMSKFKKETPKRFIETVVMVR